MEPIIVVGYSGSHRQHVLFWAAEEAARWNGKLVIVHCLEHRTETELPYPILTEIEAAESALGDAVALVRRSGARIASKLCDGPPGQHLVQMSNKAQLLVVGATLRGPASRFASASVSAYCLKRASCPVVVLPWIESTRVMQR